MKARVKRNSWSTESVIDLSDAMTPQLESDGGSVEMAARSADVALQVIGKLLARLVELNVLTFDDAVKVSNEYKYNEATLIGDEPK